MSSPIMLLATTVTPGDSVNVPLADAEITAE
jgi:hypothetical protein